MNTTDDNTDIRFRKLFEKTGLESPSTGFTTEVMDKIGKLDMAADTTADKNLFRRWIGGFGIALLAILGLSVMYYFGIGILPESFKSILSPVFANIFESFRGLFDSVEVSNTTIAIILGFTFLVILERVLNRFRFTRNIYFSF